MKAFVKKFKENFDYWFMYRTPINIKNYWLSVKFSFAGQELVIDTGVKTSKGTGRPGALYRFNTFKMKGKRI